MAVNPSRVPRAGPYYSQGWAQDIVDRIADLVRHLSGQLEVDVPLIGLSGRRKRITRVTSASYTITPADHVILVNFSGAVTLTLADGAGDGQEYIVFDTSGHAVENPITIQPESGEINGNPTVILMKRFERCAIIYDAEQPMWLADKTVEAADTVTAADLVLSTTAPTVNVV